MSAIPRSTYYYRPLTREKKKADADLRDRVEQIALEFPRYGYRRVTHQLKREGLWSEPPKLDRKVLRYLAEPTAPSRG